MLQNVRGDSSALADVPVPKREGQLDLSDPDNFKPIANVCFISKVIEKIIASQVTAYLEKNDLIPNFQSGFRKGHSTSCYFATFLISDGPSIVLRSPS